MKKNKCYWCTHRTDIFKINNQDHCSCKHPKGSVVCDDGEGWDALRFVFDSCEYFEQRPAPTTLHLILKKKWFDMIASGEKKEEYREIKDHWCTRILFHKNEIEWAAWEEMINDMQNPFHRHNGPEELMKHFGVEFKKFDLVHFRNGYQKNAPELTCKFIDITIGTGNPEWGAEPGKYYFVIKLGEIQVD